MTAGPSTFETSTITFGISYVLTFGNFFAVGYTIISSATSERNRETALDGILHEAVALSVTAVFLYLVLYFSPINSTSYAYYFLLTAETNPFIFIAYALFYFATGGILIIEADEADVSAKKLYKAWACLNFAVALFYIASLVLSFVLV